MLLRLISGLFALAIALLFAQVPGFFEEKTQQLSKQSVEISKDLSQFEEIARSTGMSMTQFMQSLESHSTISYQIRGQEIRRKLAQQAEIDTSLKAFQNAEPWSKIHLLIFNHQSLKSLPLERDRLIDLPKEKESYGFALAGFIIGIFFFSILLFLGARLKKLYKLRQARKLLASRGYGN